MDDRASKKAETDGRAKEGPAEAASSTMELESIGKHANKIHVELSTRFLEHFSEQLYSSPQKAFEELISNSWDAGADFVDVRIPDDLSIAGATMCVLDNGVSMDAEGLRDLWHIAFSPKRGKPVQNGRPVIGKFGIGKLATYVLASKLTYICKGADGKIRRVTMDYGDIERQQGATQDRLISDLTLDVFEVSESDLRGALAGVYGGDALLRSIDSGVNAPSDDLNEPDEFGGNASALSRTRRDTWTLVVLSSLKPIGKELKLHVLRRMLQAALPFGSEMTILVNGERLSSSKISASVSKRWVIGPDLGFDSVELEIPQANRDDRSFGSEGTHEEMEIPKERIEITLASTPYPHAVIPGVGIVTGSIRLFEEKISGGKSDERGASNGFHVNVLGRVVNQSDPSFGEDNLSHAAWARFRMAIRADGLNELLTTSREQFKERRETKVFRAFLRKAFNHARSFYDSDVNLGLPDGGDVLVRSLGVVSLNPLRNVVSDTLQNKAPLTDLFDESGIDDRKKKRAEWRDSTADNIKSALTGVNYEKTNDDSFVKFRIDDNTIIVNKEHPFVIEHSRSRAEKEVVRTVAMITLLSD
ncbi:MAG: ATP-binding protein, partial [Lysobacter sp.]|nr:ATP-binding protein [Lysobacter sp.]